MSEFRKIGLLVRRERQKIWETSPGLGLQSLWEQVVGSDAAAQTRVCSLRDGVLTVSCASGGWACELKLAAGDLVVSLNKLGPPERIREIRFVHQAQRGWKSRK